MFSIENNEAPLDAEAAAGLKRKAREHHRSFWSYSLRERFILMSGKMRRFYIGRFRKQYVVEQEAARKGSCHRCGACCKLLFKCPFLLEESPGLYTCRIHDNKPENCHIFPINKKDLADRDVVSPSQKCGFHFD